MVTNSTTSSVPLIDPTMGSFSTGEPVVSEVEKEENTAESVLEKKLLKVEMELPSYIAIVGTLQNTIEQALAAKNQSPTELRYHKTIVVSQRGKIDSLIQSVEKEHSTNPVVSSRLEEVASGLKKLISDLSTLEEKLPKNNEESGSQVIKIEDVSTSIATSETKPKVDGIRLKPKEIATPILTPDITSTINPTTGSVVSVPETSSTNIQSSPFVKYGQKPPTTPYTTAEVTPVLATVKIEPVLEAPKPTTLPPQASLEETTEEAQSPVKKEIPTNVFDINSRLGVVPPKILDVQKAVDVVVSSETPPNVVHMPRLDTRLEPGSAARTLHETVKVSATKKMGQALAAVWFLLPPGDSGKLVSSQPLRPQAEQLRPQAGETKFMFNLLSPEDQKGILLFALNPRNFAEKTLGISGEIFDGIMEKTSDGVISPYRILNDGTLNGLYIMVSGTQKDVRKEASDFTQTVINLAKKVQATNQNPKETGQQSMKEYIDGVQNQATAQLKNSNII